MDRNAREGKTRRALLFSNRANNYRLNSSNRGYIYICQSRRTRKPVRKRCLFAWSFKWSLADECGAVSELFETLLAFWFRVTCPLAINLSFAKKQASKKRTLANCDIRYKLTSTVFSKYFLTCGFREEESRLVFRRAIISLHQLSDGSLTSVPNAEKYGNERGLKGARRKRKGYKIVAKRRGCIREIYSCEIRVSERWNVRMQKRTAVRQEEGKWGGNVLQY